MRWFAVVAVLAVVSVALAAVGATMILVGIAEARVAHLTYQVAFVHADDDCDGAHGLYLSSSIGKPLSCEPSYAVWTASDADLPGFTDTQVTEITDLAQRLAVTGGDRLSVADRHTIQDRVDTILATVPPAERKYGDKTIWGVRRILIGALAVTLGALGGFAVWRVMKSDWI